MIGMSLAFWGYDATLDLQSDDAVFGIKIAMGIVPALLNLLSFAVLRKFMLDETSHREARERASRT